MKPPFVVDVVSLSRLDRYKVAKKLANKYGLRYTNSLYDYDNSWPYIKVGRHFISGGNCPTKREGLTVYKLEEVL